MTKKTVVSAPVCEVEAAAKASCAAVAAVMYVRGRLSCSPRQWECHRCGSVSEIGPMESVISSSSFAAWAGITRKTARVLIGAAAEAAGWGFRRSGKCTACSLVICTEPGLGNCDPWPRSDGVKFTQNVEKISQNGKNLPIGTGQNLPIAPDHTYILKDHINKTEGRSSTDRVHFASQDLSDLDHPIPAGQPTTTPTSNPPESPESLEDLFDSLPPAKPSKKRPAKAKPDNAAPALPPPAFAVAKSLIETIASANEGHRWNTLDVRRKDLYRVARTITAMALTEGRGYDRLSAVIDWLATPEATLRDGTPWAIVLVDDSKFRKHFDTIEPLVRKNFLP